MGGVYAHGELYMPHRNKESRKNTMTIGIRLSDTIPGTLRQRAAAAAAQGFAGAQLSLQQLLQPVPEPDAFTPALAQMLTSDIQPLSVAVLGCYLNLSQPDEHAYHNMLAQYRAHLRLATWLGYCVVGTETPDVDFRFDPQTTHSEEAFLLFIQRMRPVVEEAEKLQTVIAIEPVYSHIVYDPQTARRALDMFASPYVKIILDPVNLLHPDNIDRRDEIIQSALDLLGPEIVAVHMKDYAREGDRLRTLPYGLGEIDDTPVLRYIARTKPGIPFVLENTEPENAAIACANAKRQLIACGVQA
jgi:sugar phosphate isomerase/epimerase